MTEQMEAEQKQVAPAAPAGVEESPKSSGASAETEEQNDVLEGKMAEFVDWIETISVLELSRLVKALEKRLGVSAAAPAVMAPGGGAGAGAPGAGAPAEEEQSEFTVVLTDFGAQKIQVIKEVRAITGLGLKESKELVDGSPKPVKEGVSKEEADKLKEKLEGVGAKVEIK